MAALSIASFQGKSPSGGIQYQINQITYVNVDGTGPYGADTGGCVSVAYACCP